MQAGNTQGWSSRSVASRLQHRFFYALIRLGGMRAAGLTAGAVSAWYMLLRPSIRQRGRPYLQRRFAGQPLLAHHLRHANSFAQVLVDRAAMGVLGPEAVQVTFADSERMRNLLGLKGGFILVNAHVGGWQVVMSALSKLPARVNLLLARRQGDVDRHYYEHGSSAVSFGIIDPDGYMGGALEMVGALNRGEAVAIMGDRIFGSTQANLDCVFLGQPAAFPISPYRLASTTGAPIVVLLSRRIGPSRYEIDVADSYTIPPGLGRNPEAMRPYLQRYVSALEDFVQREPYQFYNFFDMWRPANRSADI